MPDRGWIPNRRPWSAEPVLLGTLCVLNFRKKKRRGNPSVFCFIQKCADTIREPWPEWISDLQKFPGVSQHHGAVRQDGKWQSSARHRAGTTGRVMNVKIPPFLQPLLKNIRSQAEAKVGIEEGVECHENEQ